MLDPTAAAAVGFFLLPGVCHYGRKHNPRFEPSLFVLNRLYTCGQNGVYVLFFGFDSVSIQFRFGFVSVSVRFRFGAPSFFLSSPRCHVIVLCFSWFGFVLIFFLLLLLRVVFFCVFVFLLVYSSFFTFCFVSSLCVLDRLKTPVRSRSPRPS